MVEETLRRTNQIKKNPGNTHVAQSRRLTVEVSKKRVKKISGI